MFLEENRGFRVERNKHLKMFEESCTCLWISCFEFKASRPSFTNDEKGAFIGNGFDVILEFLETGRISSCVDIHDIGDCDELCGFRVLPWCEPLQVPLIRIELHHFLAWLQSVLTVFYHHLSLLQVRMSEIHFAFSIETRLLNLQRRWLRLLLCSWRLLLLRLQWLKWRPRWWWSILRYW